MAAVVPCSSRPSVSSSATREHGAGIAGELGAWTTRRSAATAPRKCALDIALHDLAGKVTGLPVHELLGLSADLPPTDFTIGIDDARDRRRARRVGPPTFPALKIKVGGPADLATLEAVRAVFDGPDPRRCQHRLDARGRRRAAARPRAPRRRADRAAVPGATASTSFAGSRSARRCRSSPTRAASSLEDLDGARRRRRRGQRQAGQVRRDRARDADARARARARLPDVPRLHGGDVGRDRRLGGRRVAGRLGRPRRLPAAGGRPVRGPRAGRRSPLASCRRARASGCPAAAWPEPVHARSARAFGERPFMWITWWTKSWTSPLPGRRDRPTMAAHRSGDPGGGRPVSQEPWNGPSGRSRVDRLGPGFVLPSAVDRARSVRRPKSERRARHRWIPRTAATGPRQTLRPSSSSGSATSRRRVGWPELYDEMCAVAGRGLFRGYGADDLAGFGIGFSLFDMPALATLAAGSWPRNRRSGGRSRS